MAVNFQINGTDLEDTYVSKSYIMDRYPELANTFTTAGLWVWGNNTYGQLGINDTVPRSSPIQTISGGTNWKQVSGGFTGTAAIKNDGTLWGWGGDFTGELGTNVPGGFHKSSPVQTVAGGTNWKQVSTSRTGLTNNNTACIKTDGTLWIWGSGVSGQLGDNTSGTNKSSPVQTVASGTNWKQVACGYLITGAIKTDGTLWMWGTSGGSLGDNTTIARSSPVQTVASGTNWKQVALGTTGVGAIKTDGTLWTWGSNDLGQIGVGDVTPRSSPVQTVAGGTNWKQVSVSQGGKTKAAIKTDGTLWTWGQNADGQLGDGTIIHRSSPVQTVAGGTNWREVSAQYFYCKSIKTDGTLWAWGFNSTSGWLGDGTNIHRSSPVQTVTGGTNWKSVSGPAIRDHTLDLGLGTL
jgi:rubredoxin